MIINENSYSKQNIPRHWKLSNRHVGDIQTILTDNYKNLNIFYEFKDLQIHLKTIQERLKYIYDFSKHIKFLIPFKNKKEKSIFDNDVCLYIMKFYFYNVIDLYINNTKLTKQDLTVNVNTTEVLDDALVDFESTEGISSQNFNKNKEIVCNLICEYLNIINSHKKKINLNYDEIMEKILRSKEKEKEGFTKFLKDLTDEEREIENMKKNLKLDQWSIGLQKGLTQYVKETYDQEREIIDKNIDETSTVYNKDYDVYLMQEEQEALSLADLPDDDDYGNRDGDE